MLLDGSICARENPTWDYDRIAGASANIGEPVSDQTVGNVLRRHGIAPAPKRSRNTSWKEFIRSHMAVLAGADFFTVEVLTWRGLATYYVLFFIQLETRRVLPGGITQHPTAVWMEQMARNATDEDGGLRPVQYVLHDRNAKFCLLFDTLLKAGGVNALKLPARAPNLNAFAERWVRSVKEECLSRLILFGEVSLRRALTEFIAHSTQSGRTKGREMSCCSHQRGRSTAGTGRFDVHKGLAACSSTTPAQHE